MKTETRKLHPQQQIVDLNGNIVAMQVSTYSKPIANTVSSNYTDIEGFYVCIAPGGTEGVLKVIFKEDDTDTPYVIPVWTGGWNATGPLKKIVADAGNTVTGLYVGR